MTLTVVNVAYPFAPVGPDPVGGAEQVLSKLDRAIVEGGGRSIVVAADSSRPCGELAALPRLSGEFGEADRRRMRQRLRGLLDLLIETAQPDLVHMHGSDFVSYLPNAPCPLLITLHMPLSWYPPGALSPQRPRTWLNPVSARQAIEAPAGAELLEPIEAGVDLPAPSARPRRHAVAMGRICPEKGYHLALDAARLAGVPLLLAGEVFPYPEHLAYFREEIVPRLDHDRRWIGPVRGAKKRRLLAQAFVVLAPSLISETASLVAREALAAGAPVIAFPAGALADVVEDGLTGFLVSGVAEMAGAIGKVRSLDSAVCRARAAERFSARRMTEAYLNLYRRLARTSERAADPSAKRRNGVPAPPDPSEPRRSQGEHPHVVH
ncbi:MAG: glycosyltransferase [Caulobacteraceae bacterium]